MTTHLRAPRPPVAAFPRPTTPATGPRPAAPTASAPAADDPVSAPAGAGFVLHVAVGDAFGHGPQALADLVEAAETLQELARDLLPNASAVTTLALTSPALH